jgi:protocatechuate 3,4-dioxygenase beta subunit
VKKGWTRVPANKSGKMIAFGVVAIAAIALWLLHGHRAATPSAPHEGSAAGSAVRIPSVPIAAGPARAEVSVSDAKGPLVHATVRFVSDDGAISVATTSADGIAHAELAPGTWTISASAAGHLPKATAERKIASGETATIAIVLVAGGRPLTGLVTDTSGGPIAGARVDAAVLARNAHADAAVASTVTGPDGKYALAVGEGEVLVAVNHPDYAPQQRYAEVNASGAVVDFQLVPGGVIEGVVRDDTAKTPVGDAEVEAQLDRTTLFGEVSSHRVTAGEDGHFRITGLRPGAYSLAAHAGELLSATPTVVGLGVAEQVSDVVILVGRGAAIRGVVVDDAGTPVPNIDVGLLRDNAHGAKSDAKGAFALLGLAPGAYAIVARNDDYLWTQPARVELGAKDVEGVRVRVQRGVNVKGHIEPPQICDVELELAQAAGGLRFERPTASAAADGTFALGPIAPGAYNATAHCPSGDEGTAAVAAKVGMADVAIAVKPGGSIAGRVVDGKGKPVAGASVNAATGNRTAVVNGMVTSGFAALTGADGTFELGGLAAATYRLSVLDRGRPLPLKTAVAATTIAIGAAEHKTGVELVVDRPDGVIQGTVTGPDGKPLADAWVSVDQSIEDMLAGLDARPGESHELSVESRDEGGGATNAIAPVLTDANGHFAITGLTRAPWTVTAEAQGGKLRGRVEHVKPDATIAIAIASVRELHGTVHATPAPAWFAVELDGPTSAQRTFAWTDGTFSFARVDPGDYTVKVTSSAGTGEAKVTVGAAENGSVEITLTSNGTIVGKLVDADGKPLADIGLAVVPDTGDGRIQISLSGPPPTSGPDGSFSVPSKPGKVILAALLHGAPAMKPGLVVQAGQTLDIGTFVASPKPPPH